MNVGEKFNDFLQMWTNLTVEDIYGTEARQRYGLDDMLEAVESGSAPMFTELDFAAGSDVDRVVSVLFDAGYAYVIALNSLLNSGMRIGNISAASLWNQITATSFEGVSGKVAFDERGDRLGSLSLQYMPHSGISGM
eukprot:2683283-Amphidinium_carterae.1